MKYFVGCLGELTDVRNHLSYNYFVSLETDIRVERKKKSFVLEKIYIFQRNNQSWIKTVLLK